MPDREKVISGLEFTKAMITFNPLTGEDIEPGNLNEENKTTYDACVGAIALLKEHESVVPGLEQDADGIYSTCGNCKARLWKMFGVEFEVNPDAMPKFCPQCGKAVKWE